MQPEEINNIYIEPKLKNKKLKKAVLWITCILLVLLATPVIFVFLYQKEIKEQVVNELNKHLKVRVYIKADDIDFTILKTFPKAAVWFNNVTIMGSLPDIQNDTLLKAQSIYLLFNAKDIWNKKYIINQLTIKNAVLKVLINEDGKPNYEIWKTEESLDTKEKNTNFKLSKIVFDDFSFAYKNYKSKVKLISNFKDVTFSGNFTDVAYELNLNAQGFISTLKSNKINYVKNKNVSIDLSAAVNKNNYTIRKAEVALNKLFFSVNGSLTNADTAMPCNIICKGKNVDIQSVLSLLPESFHHKIENYESDGVFYAEANVDGNLLNYSSLNIKSSFGITNASVTYMPLKTKLNNVNFTGSFVKEKNKKEILSLQNISAKQNQNYVDGNLEIKNFRDPHLKFDAKGKYNLQDFFALVPLDTLASSKGLIDFDLNAELNINELSSKKNDAGFVNGKVRLKDVDLTFKNGKTIQIPAGLITIERDNISTENLKIIHQTSSLLISGNATNLLNYLFKENQNIYIDADITSPAINVNDFLYKASEGNSDKASGSKQKIIAINKNISATIKLNIDKIEFNGFSAKNFIGSLDLKNRKVLAKNFSFEAFGGDITLNGIADASDTNFVQLNCSTNIIDVDIKRMFSELNNFGQTTISDKNLQGKATAQIDFSAKWNDHLVCDVSSILVGADLTIERGELIDFVSLENLSKYIELKELKRIKFSTLKTHVDIKKKVIFFSKTEVSNSALNLDVWGTHSFNNEIDYHIKLLLSEFLAKRPGKSKQLDEELLESENDPESKRSVFIHMTGTTDKPIIKYDRKAMKQKIKQDLKEEKKSLKRMLNEEFGFFKKDTTLNKNKDNKKQDQKFKVDFKPDNVIEKPVMNGDDGDF